MTCLDDFVQPDRRVAIIMMYLRAVDNDPQSVRTNRCNGCNCAMRGLVLIIIIIGTAAELSVR